MEEKIKRRQPLSLTRNLTNNHSITVLSPFWQSTSSYFYLIAFWKSLPSSSGHLIWARDLQTCNAVVLWVKLRKAPTNLSSNYWYISSIDFHHRVFYTTRGLKWIPCTSHFGDFGVTTTYLDIQYAGPLGDTVSASNPTSCIFSC